MTHDGAGAAAEWWSGWPVVVASALGMTLLGVGCFLAGTFIAPLEHEFEASIRRRRRAPTPC